MLKNPDVQMLEQMKAAGVSFSDARWYHAIARPRRFTGKGDVERARSIMRMLYGSVWRAKRAAARKAPGMTLQTQ